MVRYPELARRDLAAPRSVDDQTERDVQRNSRGSFARSSLGGAGVDNSAEVSRFGVSHPDPRIVGGVASVPSATAW